MFIATNTLEIPVDQQTRMITALEKAAPSLKQFAGFISFEFWINQQNSTMLTVSHWETKEAYDTYMCSEMFSLHHGGMTSEQAQSQAHISYYTGKKLS
ncbi:MAG TPA: antibiotic biosynthesis monooxygenase family protein [Dictyobacter sp.]|jgi:heme-degrading monooxygenase HmoA|nr:antibiotic biosynthesis monooxygenase family protein [Dictyobacter sp.]